MKKAFTLIELLVVIAIIAILAAILFPVFAQAKMAAKKTQSISNMKQASLGITLYSADYDDMYPRNDDCVLNSALNAKFNNLPTGTNPAPYCTGAGVGGLGGFAFRVNHYGWQKWAQPYIKNVDLFIDPTTPKDAYGWDTLGELLGGIQINLSITGALNSWNRAPGSSFYDRPSFLGGSQTAIPNVAETMVMMVGPWNAVVPALSAVPAGAATNTKTIYWPLASKEHWYGYFYKQGGTGPCNTSTVIDKTVVPYGNVVPIGFADGHVKVMSVGDFLGKTPTSAQLGLNVNPCGAYATPNGGVVSSLNEATGWAPSATVGSWPFWGLE